jgi:hypothetical protein
MLPLGAAAGSPWELPLSAIAAALVAVVVIVFFPAEREGRGERC